MKKAIIVLPTYNEAGNITELLDKIYDIRKNTTTWDLEVLVVDDNSPDKTANIVRLLQKKYKWLHLLEGKKQGLGKAYVRGFTHALEKLNPYVLFEMDADGQHSPSLIPSMLTHIEKGADLVIGSRYMKGGSIPTSWGINRKMYSILGNLIVRLGFMNLSVKDWTGGFRAIRAWVVKDIVHELSRYTGYVFQIALLDKAIKKHAVVAEVPLRFGERTKGESKIKTGEFITNCLTYIFLNSSFVKFFIVGLLGFFVDFSVSFFGINTLSIAKPMANSLGAETAIVSNFILNNFWSFSHKKITGGLPSYVKKFIFFNTISSGSIFIQGYGMYFALQWLGDYTFTLLGFPFQIWILYKVLIIAFIIIPYSYFLYNKVVWRKK